MAVRRTEKVAMTTGASTAETVIGAPNTQWHRISAGDGTKGPRLSDWAVIRLPDNANEQGHRYILARRNIDDPTDLAYYFCYSNKPTNLEELVHVAASRWTVEECFQTGKNEAGLDHYQVRDYTAWYKHMTLAMIALAFLTIIKTAEEKKGVLNQDDSLIALTSNEIRRLLNRLLWPLVRIAQHVTHWSNWRRTSQARARSHQHKRPATNELRL